MSRPEPTEEELQAAFEAEMRGIAVQDVILQTVVTLVNLGGMRLGLSGPSAGGDRDLAQARLAIEGARALVPLLPAEPAAAIRNALTQLQMAYAREAGAAGGAEDPAATGAPAGPAAPPGAPPGAAPPAPAEPTADEAERAKARAKIWLPGS